MYVVVAVSCSCYCSCNRSVSCSCIFALFVDVDVFVALRFDTDLFRQAINRFATLGFVCSEQVALKNQVVPTAWYNNSFKKSIAVPFYYLLMAVSVAKNGPKLVTLTFPPPPLGLQMSERHVTLAMVINVGECSQRKNHWTIILSIF